LLDVLEKGEEIPPRYFLSPRACAGVLRRAVRRGRELPRALREALEMAARSSADSAHMLEKDERTRLLERLRIGLVRRVRALRRSPAP
jgi:hypothetical protein